MPYQKILSTDPGTAFNNTRTAISFLVTQLGATRHATPYHDKMVTLDEKNWWVVPAVSNHGVDLCNGRAQNPLQLLDNIQQLQAGVLILRQMADHRLCLYLITDLNYLARRLENCLVPPWDTIELAKATSDIGIMVGEELIGFRKFRKQEPTPI